MKNRRWRSTFSILYPQASILVCKIWSLKQLRIGFLSTAGIGRKNWKAIFHSGNAVVSAVASRDAQRSRKFIDDCQREFAFTETPRAFGSYEELIASPTIDAVYIPMPTGLRKKYVIQAASASKHVLCEKPCATNLAELDEMLTVCRKHSVQFGNCRTRSRPKFSLNHLQACQRNFPPNCFSMAASRRSFTVPFSPPDSNGYQLAAATAGCGCQILSTRATATNRRLS